jgi:hypothetical protein
MVRSALLARVSNHGHTLLRDALLRSAPQDEEAAKNRPALMLC